MKPEQLNWVVLAFDKATEKHVGTYALPQCDMEAFCQAMGKPSGDPLHNSLPIPKQGAAYFERLLGRVFDFQSQIYFLEGQRPD
ncbi:hypothetical protein K2X33_07055 [bacterium]|nr:hypothetical protein [bacterium]